MNTNTKNTQEMLIKEAKKIKIQSHRPRMMKHAIFTTVDLGES